ncbi:MAG: hypothetical protein JW715_10300, partial [Sedimentisphaerales bacterium]|nr:hypothetical protein [Sedimentisphaerales bacterium]
NISPAVIAGQLKTVLGREKIKFEEDLILPLAKMANGSMRDGLSLLDRLISTGAEPLTVQLLEQFLGRPNSEKIWNLIEQIGNSDAGGTLAALEDLICSGVGEVQVVDSLIDYMRDLMVVKSAGSKSELVILTEQQRQRADEIVKKFDIAALIYNIATLEKLQWAIKNSDTSRALLEASLLRFALSEHFLNVDGLLTQLKSAPAALANGPSTGTVKKKVTPAPDNRVEAIPHAADDKPQAGTLKSQNIFGQTDIQSIKDNWQNLLKIISAELGPGTGGLLRTAAPSRFEDGVLTLEFGPAAQTQKKMCESNGRAEQIRNLLGEQLSMPIGLKFEIAAGQEIQESHSAGHQVISSKRRNELICDPAVKTVLLGLDATIVNVEED